MPQTQAPIEHAVSYEKIIVGSTSDANGGPGRSGCSAKEGQEAAGGNPGVLIVEEEVLGHP